MGRFDKETLDALSKLVETHGLPIAISIFLILGTVVLVGFLLRELIRSKNQEIERVVKERNDVHDLLLARARPTSAESDAPEG